MIEYQKIFEIDDTISSVPDEYWHEVGRPENVNKGNSAKITEANYRQSIVNYIINNYDLLIANRHDIEGALVSSYSILSTNAYNSYYANVQENQKLAISIDAPATVPGKRIKIFYDSTNYGTLPITSTGANIRCRGVLYTTICLFTNGECVELESDGTYWNVVNGWRWNLDGNNISCSDWTSRDGLGFIAIVLDDSSDFEEWDIGEESTSEFRAIVIYNDIGSNTLYCIKNDDGAAGIAGFFTAARTFSEISGDATASGTIQANTKNVDSDICHMTGRGIADIEQHSITVSTDGTEANIIESLKSALIRRDSSFDCGEGFSGVDLNNIQFNIANGFGYMATGGSTGRLTTSDYFYRPKIVA